MRAFASRAFCSQDLVMDKVLVLCITEFGRRYGSSTERVEDSVMIEAEFEDQVLERVDEYYKNMAQRDPRIVRWRLLSYLPQRDLKKGTRYLH
jgi:hypothetical protein